MKEKLYNELITALSNRVDDATLNIIAEELTIALDKYEITERETALVAYDGLGSIIKVYLVTRKIEGMALSSLNLYKLRLEMFSKYCSKRAEDITANDIRLFMYRIKNEREMSDRTLEGVRTILCAFFKWAYAEGYIPNDPCANIHPIKFASKQRGHLTDEELAKVREACETPRDTAMVEFLYSTGCRVSEMVNVKIEDIKGDELNVMGKGNKERTVYLNARSRAAITDYLMSRGSTSPYLFTSEKTGKKLGKDGVEKRISQLGDKIGIELYPHLFRHTTATNFLSNGGDITAVQKLLGHSNLSTTMIYTDVADDSVKQAHRRCLI